MIAICVIVCFKASECPVDHISQSIILYKCIPHPPFPHQPNYFLNYFLNHCSILPYMQNCTYTYHPSLFNPSLHFKYSLVNQLPVYLVLTLVLLLIFWSYFLLLMLLQVSCTLSHSPGKKTIFNMSNCMRGCNLFIL